MANPIQIVFPSTSVPFVDPSSGIINTQWYLALNSLLTRTGGSQGIYTHVANTTATTAINNALNATGTANYAQGTAVNANTTASIANATSVQALALALELQVQALLKADVVISQSFYQPGAINLFNSDGSPSTLLSIYSVVVQTCVFPANMAGIVAFAGSPPSINTSFSVSLIRGGGTSQINTFTLAAGTNNQISIGTTSAATNLQSGDVLQITPLNPDSTCGNLTVTIPCSLSS
jgi:hypothetical protein